MMRRFVLALGVAALTAGCGTGAPLSLKSRNHAGHQGTVCPAPQQLVCSGGSASRIKSRTPDKFEHCACGFLRDIG